MGRYRLSLPLRRLATLIGAGLLLVFVGAVATRGPARRDTQSPVYLSRTSGLAGQTSATNPQLVGDTSISGPYLAIAAATSFNGDARELQQVRPVVKAVKPELELNESEKSPRVTLQDSAVQAARGPARPSQSMPGLLQNFAGLNFSNNGAGWPPDTNGDVGRNRYVQVVNTSIGIYSKTGTQLKAFTFDALFAGSGTACDGNNNGDPIALYDAAADRWIVADFSWTNIDNGPYYECIAASKTGDPDPITGGYWLYALRADDASHNWLSDYPKLGVWPDGIYMSANMFDCINGCSQSTYDGARVWALNRGDLYGGHTLHAVVFDTGSSYFSLLPSNFRGAAPPPGTPNYFVSNDINVPALDVFKFHVDWTNIPNSTFTGPTQVTEASYNAPPLTVPEQSGNPLDSLGDRLMMQNQYRNLAGNESLWIAHTADDPTGIRWYQLNVTGATVATPAVQQSTYAPDASNRWMPSLAVDKFGNMAVGYSASSASQFPDIRYAGRLVSDTVNTLGQDESILISGGGAQTNSCGSAQCIRWGDYSSMTVDPVDDCTFWYTTEYYATSGGDWQTRIGSFHFPACGLEPAPKTPQAYLPLVSFGPAVGNWTTIMQEGFEGTWPSAGWQVTDPSFGEYFWAKRNCRASSGSYSAWGIGGGSVGNGLNCGASYSNNANSWMIYGPVSLADATAAQFNLQLWLNTELTYDDACFMASTDGNSFSGNCISGSTANSFQLQALDLSNVPLLGNLLGQSNVYVAVIFKSDVSVTYPEGAYVDDLLLEKCNGGPCTDLASGRGAAAPGSQLHLTVTRLTKPSNVGPAQTRP